MYSYICTVSFAAAAAAENVGSILYVYINEFLYANSTQTANFQDTRALVAHIAGATTAHTQRQCAPPAAAQSELIAAFKLVN